MTTRTRWNASSATADSSTASNRVGRWAVRAEGRPDAVPRFATPRRHERPTRGHRKAKIARALGQPFMPWQQELADVAGEYDPATGIPYYGVIVATVPRQSGKTTTVLVEATDRSVNWPAEEWDGRKLGRQASVYTAQTGQAARKKLLEDQLPFLEDSELVREFLAGVTRTNGAEAIRFYNRSTYRPLPTKPDAGHGETIDLGFIDEAFDEGATPVREGALLPTMLTRPHAQLWVLSTAGTEKSVYLNEKVELGRSAVLEGEDRGICYVEFSSENPDIDIDDEEEWWRVMPALGYTQSIEAVRTARDSLRKKPGEFRRAYLNIPTVNIERTIPADVWAAISDPTAEPGDDVVIGIDADYDLRTGSVVVCDSASVIELIDTVPLGELLNLAVRVALHTGASIVLDEGGPLTAKVRDIEHELGADRVIKAGPSDITQASAEFYAAIADTDLVVRTDARFDKAAGAASKRKVGDRWAWVRHPDAIPIVAASLARWARRNPDDVEGEPEFFTL